MYAIISTLTRSKVRTDHTQNVFIFTHEANLLVFTDIGGCDGVLFFVITLHKSSNRTNEFSMMRVDMICLLARNKAILQSNIVLCYGTRQSTWLWWKLAATSSKIIEEMEFFLLYCLVVVYGNWERKVRETNFIDCNMYWYLLMHD